MTRSYATDEQYERWFMTDCCRCGRRRHKAGSWPDGHVCRTCSVRAARTRGTCSGCGLERALPGIRAGDGAAICPACAGFSVSFACSRCGFEGNLLGGRLCERCTLTDRLALLLDDGSGRVRPQLLPLLGLLVRMERPESGLAWLAMRPNHPGNAQDLLRRLGNGEIALTHEAFHTLQPWRTAAHFEELLMTCGVLPPADRQICSFERWLPGHMATLRDPEHVKTIHRFAVWEVLAGLRSRAEQVPITTSGRQFAGEQIKYAGLFLGWLAARDRTLADCRQADIDAWHAEQGTHARNRLRGFLRWSVTTRLTRGWDLPVQRVTRAAPLTEGRRLELLGRMLSDRNPPLRTRIAAIIVLLYAQPLTRVVRLTVDDVVRDGDQVLLRLGEPPSPVPEPVAGLLLDHTAARGNMNTATNQESR
ncbi:hypothetical protein [Embleya sp. NPDC005575]|uniref:hypothetical protein n=1 Tax=Embleya sp. NPDC005575 TaxID=3156892 RepID=UPI0033AF547E